MSRPGRRLRAFAARWCCPRTMERLIDPVVADLQTEHADEVRRGRKWRSRWVWIAGHAAFLKVVVWHGSRCAIGTLQQPPGDDRRVLIRTVTVSAAVVAIATLLLIAPVLRRQWPGLSTLPAHVPFYLVPGSLALAIPIGLTFGILLGFGRVTTSPRARRLVLLISVAASVTMFAVVGWVLPVSNQGFRESVARALKRLPQPPRGVREFTLGELRALRRQLELEPGAAWLPMSRRLAAFEYHNRFALSCAPFVASLLALTVTRYRRRGYVKLVAAGVGIVLGYYILLFVSRSLALSRDAPIAVVWLPNAAFVAMALVFETRRRKRAAV